MDTLKSIFVKSSSDIDVTDITQEVREFVRSTQCENGAVLVFVNGSTASISTIEYEPGLIRDIKENLKRLFPPNANYHHHKTWNDGNGYSHIMATLMKPSITVPVINAEPILGTWQQIILLDFDNKAKRREIILKLLK